jgi:hypothetical protein
MQTPEWLGCRQRDPIWDDVALGMRHCQYRTGEMYVAQKGTFAVLTEKKN